MRPLAIVVAVVAGAVLAVTWVGPALNWAEWLTLTVIGAVCLSCWIVWEYRHAPMAFETDGGYGPVEREFSSERNRRDSEWLWPDDVSHVRHGGLGR